MLLNDYQCLAVIGGNTYRVTKAGNPDRRYKLGKQEAKARENQEKLKRMRGLAEVNKKNKKLNWFQRLVEFLLLSIFFVVPAIGMLQNLSR